jgi:hypothetical protein
MRCKDIRAARRLVWASSKFTYALGLLLPHSSRSIFWAWYAYLRLIDDSIDEVITDETKRNDFLERQFQLLSGKWQAELLLLPERLIAKIAKSDTTGALRTSIEGILTSIRFDSMRAGRPRSHTELHANFKREVTSYLSAIAYFCGLEDVSIPIGANAAIAAKTAHVLRDFSKDLMAPQLNISCEDFEIYHFETIDGLPRAIWDGLFAWAATNVRIAEQLFSQSRTELKHCRHFRYKIIVVALIAKYESYLQEVRRQNFNIQHTPSLRLRRFVVNFIKNSYAVFLEHERGPNRTPMFRRLVRPNVWAFVKFTFQILPVSNHRGLSDLNSTLIDTKAVVLDRRRMDRRFRACYWIGRSSVSTIAPYLAKRESISHTAGLLFAYWGLSAIEFDCLQDERALSSADISLLSREWLQALHSALFNEMIASPTAKEPRRADYMFAVLSNRLMALVRQFSTTALAHGSPDHVHTAKEEFYRGASSLMTGQMTSMGQSNLELPKDWAWYYREIMNHKNVELILTPFRLWCGEKGSGDRFGKVASSFLVLNAAYSHYQLLDDIADMQEDINQGVIAAPGFILLSQASLAEFYLKVCDGKDFISDSITATRVVDAVRKSDLLCPEFLKSPIHDHFRHFLAERSVAKEPTFTGAETAFRCALSNTAVDFSKPLSQLGLERSKQGIAYLHGMKSRCCAYASRALLESNASNRILSAVGEEATVAAFNRKLSEINGTAEINILYIMEQMMRRTLRAARAYGP